MAKSAGSGVTLPGFKSKLLLFISCVNLDESLYLSQPCFSYLQSGSVSCYLVELL